MLGMSEYQLNLMFEYIDLASGNTPFTSMARMIEIKKELFKDAEINEIRLGDISRKIDDVKFHTTLFK